MNHGICHLDGFHMSLIAPVSEVLIHSEVVEIVGAFKALGCCSQGVEFRNVDPPGSFAL